MSQYKLILIGETRIGKTSIIERATNNVFHEEVPSTLGKTTKLYKVDCNKAQEVVFDIWDTAGQEQFRCLNKIFFKGAKVALLVYAINDRNSFNTIKDYWRGIIDAECSNKPIMALVANKADLLLEIKVPESDGRELAESMGIPFFNISCLSGDGVKEMFEEMAQIVLRENKNKPEPVDPDKIVLTKKKNRTLKEWCCGSKSETDKKVTE